MSSQQNIRRQTAPVSTDLSGSASLAMHAHQLRAALSHERQVVREVFAMLDRYVAPREITRRLRHRWHVPRWWVRVIGHAWHERESVRCALVRLAGEIVAREILRENSH